MQELTFEQVEKVSGGGSFEDQLRWPNGFPLRIPSDIRDPKDDADVWATKKPNPARQLP
ncbi:MAG: hypothetical protein ACK4GU_01895 [Alishewanella aestuarii]